MCRWVASRRTGGSSRPRRPGGRRSGRARPARRRHPQRGLRGRASLRPATPPERHPARPGPRPPPGRDSAAAAASLRIETPSARAEASAQARSSSACSRRQAARDTRRSTCRSRRQATIRSVIVTMTPWRGAVLTSTRYLADPAAIQRQGHVGRGGRWRRRSPTRCARGIKYCKRVWLGRAAYAGGPRLREQAGTRLPARSRSGAVRNGRPSSSTRLRQR